VLGIAKSQLFPIEPLAVLTATASLATRKQVIDNMRYADVPSRIINAVISGDDATVDADLRYVRSTEEVQAIKQAQADLRVAGGIALTGNALFGGMVRLASWTEPRF
jgi:hypothetical protein